MGRKRARRIVWLLTGLLSLFTAGWAAAEGVADGDACPVTQPNDQGHFGKNLRLRHGNKWLATSLSPDGKVTFRPGGPGCVDEHGALWIKWPWWRKVSGTLEVETVAFSEAGQALRAKVPSGYGRTGFQVSGLGFPGAGCWNVTGRVAEGSLSFVTFAEKIGEGPRPCERRVTSPNNQLRPRSAPSQSERGPRH